MGSPSVSHRAQGANQEDFQQSLRGSSARSSRTQLLDAICHKALWGQTLVGLWANTMWDCLVINSKQKHEVQHAWSWMSFCSNVTHIWLSSNWVNWKHSTLAKLLHCRQMPNFLNSLPLQDGSASARVDEEPHCQLFTWKRVTKAFPWAALHHNLHS